MTEIKILEKNIKLRNIIAVSLITILIFISSFTLIILFKGNEEDAKLINLSGSQRMLSQKIAYLSLLHHQNLTSNLDSSTIKEAIQTSANLFLKNQNFLSELSVTQSDTIPKEVADIYFNAPHYLNNKIKRYVYNARKLSETSDTQLANEIIIEQFTPQVVDPLLIELDMVVKSIEQHVNNRIAYSQKLKIVIWVFMLVSFVLFAVVLLKPIHRVIRENYLEVLTAKQRSAELSFAMNKHAIVY
ncbi:MAG: type IV pili methyl-accepting chemotaxis transducer N-terminal domain-containing protein, partial [Nonlabens ulvanivorans]|uniref:type IV pili methyl-accepting chemotaxis transducer N-terminal domain-containing protein n=1 Tax=Nonlabens ulvanivorans TaxID=906888 RepID=UPI003265FBB6